MPKKPQPGKQRRVQSDLTGPQIMHLCWGWTLGNGLPFDSWEERKEKWFAHRDFLMGLEGKTDVPGVWKGRAVKKGEKPAAYYEYETKLSKVDQMDFERRQRTHWRKND